ncbi:hypothetical protein CARUB_v10002014mg [Capsella rubella]|uniref:Uncharacterized protein n=1 Tax=Capsella rubella TaxID=81985 RepID=R0FHW4_9BRAS|nr:hypothetical protein CARUB_v10002014mg [Capsella rubella]
MVISFMANAHLNQPYVSASTTTTQEKGRTCRYAGQAVRALPIRVITVGKKRSEGVRLLVDEYRTKLKPYCSFEDSLVRSNPRNAQDVKAQVEDEEVAMMKLIGLWCLMREAVTLILSRWLTYLGMQEIVELRGYRFV